MARQFRVNELILSGKSITFDPVNTTQFLRKDGSFATPDVSGSSSNGNLSGEAYQRSIYLENPTTNDNLTWFFNENPTSLVKVVSAAYGTSGSGVWALYQTLDTSVDGSLICSGLTNSSTVGNVTTSFSNAFLSGTGFVKFKVLATGGAITGISLTLVGQNLLSLGVSGLNYQPDITTLNNWTGTTPNIYYPLKNNVSGYIQNGQVAFVGLNNSTPVAQLDISGALSVSHNLANKNIISATGNLNNYIQLNVVNLNTGQDASSDIVASNSSSDTSNYVNLGINSINYTGAFVGYTGDGYLFSAAGDFYIGNTNVNKSLSLFAGGSIISSTGADIFISSLGKVGVNNNNPRYTLEISGSGNFLGQLAVSGNPVITGFPNQFISGLQLNTSMALAGTFYTALSGNIGPGTWLASAMANVRTPGNTSTRVTTKLWNTSTVWGATENSAFATGITNSGYLVSNFNQVIVLTGASNAVALSCAASNNGCWILSAPSGFATGILSGTATTLQLIKLY